MLSWFLKEITGGLETVLFSLQRNIQNLKQRLLPIIIHACIATVNMCVTDTVKLIHI